MKTLKLPKDASARADDADAGPRETPIDLAFAAHAADPEDGALRLRFHERVLDAELVVPLVDEPAGERIEPIVFELSEGRFVLAFDRDERLAAFLEAPTAFAALAGRQLVEMLAGGGLGIGLNLGAASAALLPADAIDWMAGIVAAPGAAADEGRILGVAAPEGVPPALTAALAPKLAAMAEAVPEAWLVTASLEDGAKASVLLLASVAPEHQAGIARALEEAVRFIDGDLELAVAFADPPSLTLEAARRAGVDLTPRPGAAPPKGPNETA